MSANFNTGKVVLEFRDAYNKFIFDTVLLKFRNLKLKSLDFPHQVELTGVPFTLEGVPAFPDGNWQVEIYPQKYRFKSVFLDLPSNGTEPIKETFFVDPSKVSPVLPTLQELQTADRWKALWDVLKISPVEYESLDAQQRAGLLNLFAKMNHKSSNFAFRSAVNIFKVKPARIFAQVKNDFWDLVRQAPDRFHEESDNGSMHSFGDGWTRLAEHASFKTPDPMGNLQVTFANNAAEQMAVDADLDDHQGIQHVFDVIKHKFSGDTHPYDIHQVLVKFQEIDPGYHFV
jgi:hypothetical protein